MQRTPTLALIVALGVLGCGSSESPAPEPSAGDDTPVATPPPAEEEPLDEEDLDAFEEEPAGPGDLEVTLRLGNQDASGRVQVLDASGAVVAEGESGQRFSLPAGSYRVVGELAPGQLRGTGARDEQAEVRAGARARVTVSWAVARVRIDVRRRGQSVARWRLVVTREGSDEQVELQPSDEHAVVLPGRYSGVLTFGTQRIDVTGIIFQGGATMDVPINVD